MLKQSTGFRLYTVGGEHMIVPLGVKGKEFNGMIRLNESGVSLWEKLGTGTTREELVRSLTEVYEITEQEAGADVDAFIEKLQSVGAVEQV